MLLPYRSRWRLLGSAAWSSTLPRSSFPPMAWCCARSIVTTPCRDGSFTAMASGAALASGIPLNDQFLGTGYHKDLRLWGDFGSQLYLVEQLDENEEDNTK